MLLEPMLENKLNKNFLPEKSVLRNLLFTGVTSSESTVYTFTKQKYCAMQETVEHRIIRSRHAKPLISEIKDEPSTSTHVVKSPLKSPTRLIKSPLKSPPVTCHIQISQQLEKATSCGIHLQPEFPHINRSPQIFECEPTEVPRFLYNLPPKISCPARKLYCETREAAWEAKRFEQCDSKEGWNLIDKGFKLTKPISGWSNIIIPDKQTLVSDAGKLAVLDSLLTRLKSQGHRVLIYSQMTKMIDLLEEYMWHRKHRYMRLDGSSKIAARRDMVADFQTRADIFVFLLSTRAGGLGINLTAADTVSFYFFLFIGRVEKSFKFSIYRSKNSRFKSFISLQRRTINYVSPKLTVNLPHFFKLIKETKQKKNCRKRRKKCLQLAVIFK